MRDALRGGALVDDRTFDGVYPFAVRLASPMHWTPVQAAVRASKLLAVRPGARILDVGSGVGKFCIVAAASVDARVAGVEQRGYLVDIGRRAASAFGVDVAFTKGTLEDCDPLDVDGVYLFNPFAENVCAPGDRIDDTVELSEARFVRDILAIQRFLRAARVGTRVVTYCGLGGAVPNGYVRQLAEACAGRVELWVKTRPSVVVEAEELFADVAEAGAP